MKMVKSCLFGVSSALAIASVLTPAAQAQTGPAARVAANQRFDIPAGSLSSALNRWSRLSGRSLVFRSSELRNVRTSGTRGEQSSDAALDRLLAGTGFSRVNSPDGSIAIVGADQSSDNVGNAIPEILVQGQRNWSLNTGIERTQNDSQPFIVMTREEIRRSGAPNLETFLRDRLNVNSSPNVSEQAAGGSSSTQASRGTSSINLRGLGTRDTLILIDGRRQPGVNFGSGTITQTQLTGIPIESIERIEVLASSASGIYGSGASGGVINIVLKRDFTGGTLTSSYNNTTDFAQGQGRIDLTYGAPLEGGRTRLSLTGGWAKSHPLLFGDRLDLRDERLQTLLDNNGGVGSQALSAPPNAQNVNFVSFNTTAPLRLKPAFGGATLASSYGTVPAGYRGVAADGVTPLLAGIGRYDLTPSDSATPFGSRYPLLYGSEQFSGSLTVRRQFNSWLDGYVGLTASRYTSTNLRPRGFSTVRVAANAPGNPFTTGITVSIPGVGGVTQVESRTDSQSLVAGAIVKLWPQWQMAIDLSYSRNRFAGDIQPPQVSDRTARQLQTGVQNVLRDLSINPLDVSYDQIDFYTYQTPGRSSTFMPSVRIAGPLPFSLPGGKPQVTLNIDYTRDSVGETLGANVTELRTVRTYKPAVTQTAISAYGEIAFPIFSKENDIPLLRELELRFSARAERYKGNGADPFPCDRLSTSISLANVAENCPPPGAAIRSASTESSRIDPSISLRWTPVAPLTFRGSYTTGYLPPTLVQLVRQPQPEINTSATDPLRGNEVVGVPAAFPGFGRLSGFSGGNPDVLPESSKSLTVGAILNPVLVPGLRFSADWTRIRKRNVYFDPISLLFGGAAQPAFEIFLAANPDRAVRAAPSDGYTVGRITSLDVSLVNLLGLSTDTIDFTMDYNRSLFGGNLSLVSRATYVDSLRVETFPGVAPIDYAGIVPVGFAAGNASNAALRWRGSGAVSWTKGGLTLGWATRYLSGYALNAARTVVLDQGSATVKSQTYHDLNVSYRFDIGATLSLNVNNVFNTWPPYDSTSVPLFYSSYGNPRLRDFTLTFAKTF